MDGKALHTGDAEVAGLRNKPRVCGSVLAAPTYAHMLQKKSMPTAHHFSEEDGEGRPASATNRCCQQANHIQGLVQSIGKPGKCTHVRPSTGDKCSLTRNANASAVYVRLT